MFKKNKKKEEEFKKSEVPAELYEKTIQEPDVVVPIEEPVAEELPTEVPEIDPPTQELVEETDEEILALEEKMKSLKIKKEQEKIMKVEGSRIMVVKELPESPVRRYKDKDGSVVDLITTEEAITEILYLLKNK